MLRALTTRSPKAMRSQVPRQSSHTRHLSSLRCLIMGPPGGGKGTLSSRLVKEHYNNKEGTQLGKEAKGFMDKGELVPDNLLVDVVLAHVVDVEAKTNRWLLDGFPRTVNQAKALDEAFSLDIVVNLDIPHEEIVERLRHRMVHLPSGRSYHRLWSPPKVEGKVAAATRRHPYFVLLRSCNTAILCVIKDDETGEELVVRDDDQPEAVRDRLRVYEENTRPVLDHYMRLDKAVIWPEMKRHIQEKFNL